MQFRPMIQDQLGLSDDTVDLLRAVLLLTIAITAVCAVRPFLMVHLSCLLFRIHVACMNGGEEAHSYCRNLSNAKSCLHYKQSSALGRGFRCNDLDLRGVLCTCSNIIKSMLLLDRDTSHQGLLSGGPTNMRLPLGIKAQG